MPNLEIKQLYSFSRFPESSTKILAIILYLPLGLVLGGVRAVLGLLLYVCGCILPNIEILRVVLNKLICFTFGISISVENLEKKEDVDLYISNQVSVLDHLVLTSVTGSISPGEKLPNLVSAALGVRDFGCTSNVATLKENICKYVSENDTSLFLQPETLITNGNGILKFHLWPFEVCRKVQPVVIKTYRPVIDLSLTTIDNSYWNDLLCFLFTPCTIYQLKFLPVSEKKGMRESVFSEIIRLEMAASLKIPAANFSAVDMKEWEKRYRTEQIRLRQVQPPVMTSVNPELHRMTLQVREVLPLVPYNVVYKDLTKTRNVDITITNILEGHVPYTPENIQQPVTTSRPSTCTTTSSSSVTTTPSTSSADFFNTAASSFGKNAQERNLSFQERKQLLIANARKRYIEKHNLQNLVLNNC